MRKWEEIRKIRLKTAGTLKTPSIVPAVLTKCFDFLLLF